MPNPNVTATVEHDVVMFCPFCGEETFVPTTAAPSNGATGTTRCAKCQKDFDYTVNTAI